METSKEFSVEHRITKKYCILHGNCNPSIDNCKDLYKTKRKYMSYRKSNKEQIIEKKFQSFLKNRKRRKTEKELQRFKGMQLSDDVISFITFEKLTLMTFRTYRLLKAFPVNELNNR